MYLFLVNYKKPLEEVEKNLEAHRAYLDKYYSLKKFIFPDAGIRVRVDVSYAMLRMKRK